MTDGAPRATGDGDTCRSSWGAEDMIGNVGEWVADWFQAGMGWATGDGASALPWPPGYGEDRVFNVNGRTVSSASFANGSPAAAIRGGSYADGTTADGTNAGAFALTLYYGPSSAGYWLGARCCVGEGR